MDTVAEACPRVRTNPTSLSLPRTYDLVPSPFRAREKLPRRMAHPSKSLAVRRTGLVLVIISSEGPQLGQLSGCKRT